jgi:hypothetical protein
MSAGSGSPATQGSRATQANQQVASDVAADIAAIKAAASSVSTQAAAKAKQLWADIEAAEGVDLSALKALF